MPAEPFILLPHDQTTRSSETYVARLEMLRQVLRDEGLEGFLIPMADVYQNEYVAPSDQRIGFLTGFTGSAAFVIVMQDRAAFFTDSRYMLVAGQELPASLYDLFDMAAQTPSAWLAQHLRAGQKIGFDPSLHTSKQVQKYEEVAITARACLVPALHNPIDGFWTGRPLPPAAPIEVYDIRYAGEDSLTKRRGLVNLLQAKEASAALITNPASVAWLLNVRGGDVDFTPLPCSMALVYQDTHVDWFVDTVKVDSSLAVHQDRGINAYPLGAMESAIESLAQTRQKILVDEDTASYKLVAALHQAGVGVILGLDPTALPRACKNKTEIEGMKAAHRRDGLVMCKLLAWIDQQASNQALREMDVMHKLASLRAYSNLYRGPSFETIAASGPNGAIVHYHATPQTNRKLDQDSFFLLDCGAQYLDGTTDITRTIVLGSPSDEMKDHYTRVLKGHIALATARFPVGTAGADLDVLARQFLWQVGLDYGHGTGHGVGVYLGVHEGPQSISKRSSVALQEGMVLSNEPGFYKEGAYGVRLENLIYVVKLPAFSHEGRVTLGFEVLTLVPFDRRAIVTSMLTEAEKAWINLYHEHVHMLLGPQLDVFSRAWLDQATRPL